MGESDGRPCSRGVLVLILLELEELRLGAQPVASVVEFRP